MSDPDSVAAGKFDRGTQRLLRNLTVVGLFLEDRVPARERAEAMLGDLAGLCRPPGAEGAYSQNIEPERAA